MSVVRLLHLWLGLVAGVVLALVGLSGAGLAFREEIDQALYPALHYVEGAEAVGSPDAVMATLRAAGHDARPARIRFPRGGGGTWEVQLADGLQAYVAPGGGRVVGTRVGREAPMAKLLQFHEKLWLDEIGGRAVSLATLAMLYLVGSGLWMGLRRVRTAGLAVRAKYGWRVLALDVHGALGYVAAAFLTVSALTGTAFYYAGALTKALGIENPAPAVADPGPAPAIGPMLAAAKARFPQGEPIMIRVPKDPQAAWRFDLRQPGEAHPNGRSLAWVDPNDGKLLDAREPATAGLAWRAFHAWNYPLHVGMAGGWPHRLIMPLVGLMPAVLLGTGVAIRLGKRRRAPKPRPGAVAA